MPLVSSRKVLKSAMKKGFALGHFNIENIETITSVVRAANETKSPVMLAATESAISYAGLDYLVACVRIAAKSVKVPVVLHLDHGKHIETVKQCIKAGFTSVMLDASHLIFEKNVAATLKVVKYAKRYRVCVEAELGVFEKSKDVPREAMYTDPFLAQEFVKRTGIDSLAIAIGTSHGAYKFKDKPKLDFKRLELINKLVDIPLVLHGASSIPQDVVKKGIKYGAKWQGALGVDDTSLKKACKIGIDKVNIHTDLNLIRIAAYREYFHKFPQETDPRKLNNFASEQMVAFVKKKMDILESSGKA